MRSSLAMARIHDFLGGATKKQLYVSINNETRNIKRPIKRMEAAQRRS